MKKLFTIIICAVFIQTTNINAQSSFPQLQAGVYVNDSIESLDYYFAGTCNPLYDVDVFVDTNLIPVVTGVELKYVVTQLTTLPDSVYSLQGGVLHLNDTLSFSSGNPLYRFYSPVTGMMHLKLIIIGTPTIPFESYSCEFIKLITLSNCANGAGILGLQTQCSVDNFNGIHEANDELIFSMQPNPVENILTVKSNSNAATIEIFNLSGSSMYIQSLNANENKINLEFLPSGIYFLRYSVWSRERMIKFVKQ